MDIVGQLMNQAVHLHHTRFLRAWINGTALLTYQGHASNWLAEWCAAILVDRLGKAQRSTKADAQSLLPGQLCGRDRLRHYRPDWPSSRGYIATTLLVRLANELA